MKYNRQSPTVLEPRYANTDVVNGYTSTVTDTSTNTGTTSGWSGWSFLNNLSSGLFGWLTSKQNTNLASVTSAQTVNTDSNKTTRTTIIVLGLVALAIVAAIIIKSRKK